MKCDTCGREMLSAWRQLIYLYVDSTETDAVGQQARFCCDKCAYIWFSENIAK